MGCQSMTTQNGREITVLIAPGVPNFWKSKSSNVSYPKKRMIRIGSISNDDNIPVLEDLSSKVKSIIMIKDLLMASVRRWYLIN